MLQSVHAETWPLQVFLKEACADPAPLRRTRGWAATVVLALIACAEPPPPMEPPAVDVEVQEPVEMVGRFPVLHLGAPFFDSGHVVRLLDIEETDGQIAVSIRHHAVAGPASSLVTQTQGWKVMLATHRSDSGPLILREGPADDGGCCCFVGIDEADGARGCRFSARAGERPVALKLGRLVPSRWPFPPRPTSTVVEAAYLPLRGFDEVVGQWATSAPRRVGEAAEMPASGVWARAVRASRTSEPIAIGSGEGRRDLVASSGSWLLVDVEAFWDPACDEPPCTSGQLLFWLGAETVVTPRAFGYRGEFQAYGLAEGVKFPPADRVADPVTEANPASWTLAFDVPPAPTPSWLVADLGGPEVVGPSAVYFKLE